MKTLEEYTLQEIAAEAARVHALYGPDGIQAYWAWIGELRQECFERRAATMDPDRSLTSWVEQMTARYGPRVRVFRGTYSWLAALGVARYGEAPDHWPVKFPADDVIRANRWLYQGKVPEGVTYIEVED